MIQKSTEQADVISIKGAKEHNLKNVNLDIPKNRLVVITGVSGSGKSSIAFDTLYAEGQRRYVESLSTYARQFLDKQDKPNVEQITGLSPAIAIDQKTTSRNPRSTVSTATEIYDYMRLLYARIGIPHSPATGRPIEKQTPSQIIEAIKSLPLGTKICILSPIVRGSKGEHRKEMIMLQKHGYSRVRIDGIIYEMDDLPSIDKNKRHEIEVVVDRIEIEQDPDNRLADSVEMALKISDGLIYLMLSEIPEDVIKKGDKEYKKNDLMVFSEKFSCPVSGFSITEIEPRIFSFNSPYGACKSCDGLGVEQFFNPNLIIPDPSLSLKEGAIEPWSKDTAKFNASYVKLYEQIMSSIADHFAFSAYTPFEELDEDIQSIIMNGSDDEIEFTYDDGFKTTKNVHEFEGVIKNLERRSKNTESEYVRDELSKYKSIKACSVCSGHRLKQESLHIKIADLSIGQVSEMTVLNAIEWFGQLHTKLSPKHLKIADRVLKEVLRRLSFLNDVGLEYLTLNRGSGTLSGGESQRIRLASQIGSGLSGVLYVLDEPSIGLHQRDNDRLLHTLRKLRDLGNTVVVVEHDEDTIRFADYLVDVGLGAGIHGGNIIAKGTPDDVANVPESITGGYLSKRLEIDVPKQRRIINENKVIEVIEAQANNLKSVSVKFPLGTFISVTGVSGSGKSTLTIHTLYKAAVKKLHNAKTEPGKHTRIKGLEYIDKVIEIDQSPIGRTPRSNPATYAGAFTPIRDWFAALPEAKMRGYRPGRFSFNVKGGRCEACEGDGVLKIEMHFLPDVYVKCDECDAMRYNKETLEVKYKDQSIADVLQMTVDDARVFFDSVPIIKEKLVALQDVGLGYISIGQSATTLSGGEAQRIKLAKELSRKSTGRTLYILDEPTTGLHSHDIKKLLKVLHTFVENGNTVVVIEHNLDVIKTSDYIIDIGPFGGDKGGVVVATGSPEQVIKVKDSITGEYLAPYLDGRK